MSNIPSAGVVWVLCIVFVMLVVPVCFDTIGLSMSRRGIVLTVDFFAGLWDVE